MKVQGEIGLMIEAEGDGAGNRSEELHLGIIFLVLFVLVFV